MARKVTQSVALNDQNVRGKWAGFKRTIGGERFFFGASFGVNSPKDRPAAERAASAIVNEWKRIKSNGAKSWNANQLQAVKKIAQAYALGNDPHAVPKVAPVFASVPDVIVESAASQGERVTLYRAMEMYLKEKTAELDTDTVFGYAQKFKAIKTATQNGQPIAPDIAVEDYNRELIRGVVGYFKTRPISEKTGHPVKYHTIKGIAAVWRSFWNWASNDDAELYSGKIKGEWFAVDEDQILTVKEKREKKDGSAKFTIDELGILYAAANRRQRLYILLGLQCGMGQKEQATLLKDDIKENQIIRDRNKTGVEGRWPLWPETRELLLSFVDQCRINRDTFIETGMIYRSKAASDGREKNERYWNTARPTSADIKRSLGLRGVEIEDLALVSDNGYPLIFRSDPNLIRQGVGKKGSKTDTIAKSWQRLMDRLDALKITHNAKAPIDGKIRKLNFYQLRHTGLQLVRDKSDLATSKVFAAQASIDASGRVSVNEKHYTNRTDAEFQKVADALAIIYEMLQPMFAAARRVDADPSLMPSNKGGWEKGKKRIAA